MLNLEESLRVIETIADEFRIRKGRFDIGIDAEYSENRLLAKKVDIPEFAENGKKLTKMIFQNNMVDIIMFEHDIDVEKHHFKVKILNRQDFILYNDIIFYFYSKNLIIYNKETLEIKVKQIRDGKYEDVLIFQRDNDKNIRNIKDYMAIIMSDYPEIYDEYGDDLFEKIKMLESL